MTTVFVWSLGDIVTAVALLAVAVVVVREWWRGRR